MNPLHIDQDLAHILLEQYDSYASMLDDEIPLDPEWVLEKLQETFTEEDISLLIDDDFGRGILMGQLRALFVMESILNGEEEAEV